MGVAVLVVDPDLPAVVGLATAVAVVVGIARVDPPVASACLHSATAAGCMRCAGATDLGQLRLARRDLEVLLPMTQVALLAHHVSIHRLGPSGGDVHEHPPAVPERERPE